MLSAFNNAQLEVLKILEYLKDEKDLAEIKSLLITHLSNKVVGGADKTFDEKKYIADIFEEWKKEHFRKSEGSIS